MATYTGTTGTDSFTGTAGADLFVFRPGDVQRADTIDGGAGSDTLRLEGTGTINAINTAGIRNIENLVFANGGIVARLSTINPNASTPLTVTGSGGNDTLDFTGVPVGGRFDVTAGAGNDSFYANASGATFRFAADQLTGSDIVSGSPTASARPSTLVFTTAGSIAAEAFARVTGVGRIELANGTNKITLAAALAPTYREGLTVIGGSGNDRIEGGAIGGKLDITAGAGNDVLIGGVQDDIFRFGAGTFTAADVVTGGTGTDTLRIEGNVTLRPGDLAGVSGVEALTFTGSADVVLDDAFLTRNAAALRVNGSTGNDRIDATGVGINRSIQVIAGRGNDTLLGGAGDDGFTFTADQFDAGDVVIGGAGRDQLTLTYNGPGFYTVDAGAFANVRGVEELLLGYTIDGLIVSDAMVASAEGRQLSITHSGVAEFGPGVVTIDASAVSARGGVSIAVRNGDTVLLGGAGSDYFQFQDRNLNERDVVTGGAGYDTLGLAGGTYDGVALSNVTEIEAISIYGNGGTVVLDDNVLANNGGRLAIYNSAAHGAVNGSGILDAANRLDVTTGSYGILQPSTGGAGDDVFRYISLRYTYGTAKGGGGNDTILLQQAGSYEAYRFEGLSQFESLVFGAAGTSVILPDVFVANADDRRLVVVGTAGNDAVDARAVTSTGARVEVVAGGGDDSFYGSAGADVFHFAATALTAADLVDGRAGSDRLLLNAAGAVTLGGNVRGIETLSLGVGGIAATLTDAFASANAGRLAVRGGAGNDTVIASGVTNAGFAIETTTGGGDDDLRGGVGDDTFRFAVDDLTGADAIRGGAGLDTLRLTTSGLLTAGDLAQVTGVERILLADGNDNVTVSQTVLTGSGTGALEVLGGGGNDRLAGTGLTGSGVLTLDGGAGDDTLLAAGATARGGTGADTFLFAVREGLTGRIADFTAADDTLAFAASSYAVPGGAFDLLTDDATGTADLTGADVIRYTGAALDDAGDVAAYLQANGSGAATGAFVLGVNAAGQSVLWHVSDASGAAGTAVLVADLGATAAGSLTIADFVLV